MTLRRLTRKQIEEQFARIFVESPLVVTLTSAKNDRYIEVNESFERATGWRRDEVIGRTPYDVGIWINPRERADLVKRLWSEVTVHNLHVRIRIKNGDQRTSLGSAELIEIEGEPCVLSVAIHVTDAINVTERKLTEDASSKVSQRLIEAQEKERAIIAQDLHRYIDSLTVLAISLGRGQNPPASLTRAWETIAKAKQQAEDIVCDVWTLLRRLHPAKLDYLGLAAAASSFCKELSEAQNVNINFHGEGIPKNLSKEISLCLYRVLQEALHNAIEHSKSRVFDVALTGQSHEIQLTVRDWGLSFDSAPPMKGSGLGLITMRERLKLVDGELVIESQPQHGTTIRALVPYKDG